MYEKISYQHFNSNPKTLLPQYHDATLMKELIKGTKLWTLSLTIQLGFHGLC